MSLDLQKVTLRRLFDTQSHDLYSKLVPPYFSGANLAIFNKLASFYKANLRIPSLEEFETLKKEISLQEYFETQITIEENQNNDIEKRIFLQIMDFLWRSHLQYLEQLRQVIGLRSYGQKDPLAEFRREAFQLFEDLLIKIKSETIKFLRDQKHLEVE